MWIYKILLALQEYIPRVDIACFKSLAIALIPRNLSLSIIIKKWEKFIINGFQSSSYCFLILISKIREQEKKEFLNIVSRLKKKLKRMKLYLQRALNYRTSKIPAISLSLSFLSFFLIHFWKYTKYPNDFNLPPKNVQNNI